MCFATYSEQLAMDSLLYLGAGADDDDDDDNDDDEEEEPQVQEETEKKKPDSLVGSGSLDFAALQRAGYSTATDLRETATYKLLGEAEEREREAMRMEAEAEAEAEAARVKVMEAAQEELLNQKKMDEKLGYKKRFDQTGENFRAKEKRKREQGQQSRCVRLSLLAMLPCAHQSLRVSLTRLVQSLLGRSQGWELCRGRKTTAAARLERELRFIILLIVDTSAPCAEGEHVACTVSGGRSGTCGLGIPIRWESHRLTVALCKRV